MGRMLEIVTPLHKATKRDYLARMNDDKVHCMLKAKEYGAITGTATAATAMAATNSSTAVGSRSRKALIDIYGLKSGSSLLDVGCGKAFLLYEMKQILPDLKIVGFDISKHGLANAHDDVKPHLFAIRHRTATRSATSTSTW